MMNKTVMKTLALALMLASGGAFAQATPRWLWKVIDDETKQPLSYVRIGDAGGVLSGRMEKLIDPSRQDGRCDKCTDERKDQPMLGMTNMRNVNAAGDSI